MPLFAVSPAWPVTGWAVPNLVFDANKSILLFDYFFLLINGGDNLVLLYLVLEKLWCNQRFSPPPGTICMDELVSRTRHKCSDRAGLSREFLAQVWHVINN